ELELRHLHHRVGRLLALENAANVKACGRAASGHAVAPPPSRMTKSRRRIPDTRASPSLSVRRRAGEQGGKNLCTAIGQGWRGRGPTAKGKPSCQVYDG